MKSGFMKNFGWNCLAVSVLLLFGQLSLHAQGQSVTQNAPSQAAMSSPRGDDDSGAARVGDQYRIGPRDILTVRVIAGRLVPELSMEAIEVDECGKIPLLSVEHETQTEIQAAGKMRTELAEELRLFYKKYKKNPQVIVYVKEYNSQPVAINGAVVKPGQFQMRRPVRLLELVQFYAGGPTDRTGGKIQVARMSAFNPCMTSTSNASNGIEFMVLNLNDTLSGEEKANPYLQPGDVVTLPEAKEAYIVGNILRPGPILLKDDKVTLSKAIAMAGGQMPDTKDIVRIMREGQTKTYNLKAIRSNPAADVVLLPGDIVNVDISGGKRLLRSLVGAIVPTVGQLPVQVIR